MTKKLCVAISGAISFSPAGKNLNLAVLHKQKFGRPLGLAYHD
jgi:hypothetical protein